MSKIEVDAIEPQSGTTLTIGASGDTITIPSGATLSSTDPLVFPAGTVSLPAITTTGDTNTGIFFPAADTIAFTEGGAEAMRITSDGTVGINKTSLQPFLVNGSRGSGMGAYPTWEATVGRNLALFETDQSEGTFVLGSPTNGYAQLGFADPYGLSLNSTTTSGTQYHLRFARGGTSAGYITSNSATTIAVNNSSDERLKENIENSGSAIQDIKDIQVRQFDWIDNIDTHRDFGFVAQELVNVVPEAVTQGTDELDDNGKPVRSWGVDYSHIVPRLVKVCQEQQTKIEELEARITALETQP
jgi:hypothetical protein